MELAAERGADVVVFDGSGAAVPPVAAEARILVAHDLESGLNPYRALISELVLTTSDEVAAQAGALGRRAIRFDLRLRPVEPLAGRRTALFTTGPARFDHLGEIVSSSRSLADRAALRSDLEHVDAEVFLVELKAAAIDVVAEAAAARGAEVVLATYDVEAPGLDDALLELAELAVGAQPRENLTR
jgi:cyclic 2,3-diphosphoglycerate synthetase